VRSLSLDAVKLAQTKQIDIEEIKEASKTQEKHQARGIQDLILLKLDS
jgi:hypothetical protein